MFPFGRGGGGGNTFSATYRAFPLAFIDKQSAEYGDKVILPPSALDRLASLHIEYPMLFRVETGDNKGGAGGSSAADGAHRATHCGVLEFIAEEGRAYLPRWMMQNLLLSEGSFVRFSNVSLPKGTYVKLQPTTSDFLDISNPKAVLERTLRAYSCLTKGDSFVVHYNDREYELEVRESRPGDAVSIIETDCQVDFEAPKDYVEPQRVVAPKAAAAGAAGGSAAGAGGSGAGGAAGPSGFSMGAAGGSAGGGAGGGGAEAAAEDAGPAFVPFVGSGNRLDGKPAAPAPPPPPPIVPAAGAGGAGRKAGTFVSTGNRLLDKLERDRLAAAAARGGGGGEAAGAGAAAPAAAAGGAAAGAGAAAGGSNGAAAAAAKPADGDKTDEGPKFEAFKGKAFTLK